jgi:hypothetical protein
MGRLTAIRNQRRLDFLARIQTWHSTAICPIHQPTARVLLIRALTEDGIEQSRVGVVYTTNLGAVCMCILYKG